MLEKIKFVIVAIFAGLSSFLGTLAIPVYILVLLNVLDYGTGICAAKYRNEKVNSYKGFRGIAKKVCMWLLVAVGGVLDWLVMYAADKVGINYKLTFLIAALVAIWLIANELLSILENMIDIGVKMPGFLISLAKNIKSSVEKKAGESIPGEDNK